MKRVVMALGIALLAFSSCRKDEGGTDIKMIVASEERIGPNWDGGERSFMMVKEGSSTQWRHFDDGIEGFAYELGYEYVLWVTAYPVKDPPQDASSIRYVLKEMVSKIEKDSEGLPEQTYPWRK